MKGLRQIAKNNYEELVIALFSFVAYHVWEISSTNGQLILRMSHVEDRIAVIEQDHRELFRTPPFIPTPEKPPKMQPDVLAPKDTRNSLRTKDKIGDE